MGLDYNYSQPSSDDFGNTVESGYSETEYLIRRDQAKLSLASLGIPSSVQYPPQPEVEFAFPQTCYCGARPFLTTANTINDPGRRYYTCANVDDSECHVWKWLDVAVMEEMRAMNSHIHQLEEKVDSLSFFDNNDTDQKVDHLEHLVAELVIKKSRYDVQFDAPVRYLVGVLVILDLGLMLLFVI